MTDKNGHSSRATHRRQELIHTSCRSESSNISLVVLDNEVGFGHHLQGHHPQPALGENGVKLVLLAGEPGGKVEAWAKACMARHVLCTFAHLERVPGLAQKEFLLSSSTCASAAIPRRRGEPGQPAFHTAARLAGTFSAVTSGRGPTQADSETDVVSC